MILHTNFEMFDDSEHEYCIHPRRLSVLTEYLSLSLIHFTPINIANHFIQTIGPIPFRKETCFNYISIPFCYGPTPLSCDIYSIMYCFYRSVFYKNRQTILLTHGYLEKNNSLWLQQIKDALLDRVSILPIFYNCLFMSAFEF